MRAGADVQDVLAAAHEWYADALTRSVDAQAYLEGRGVPVELARALGVGYAPPGWRGLTDHLLRRRVSEDQAVAAGVSMPTSKNVVDKLRGRVVLPVKDETGRLVGFTGRLVAASETAPKYLDVMPPGVKSRVLHGLADGRRLLADGAIPVITEGPLDAIGVTRTGGRRYVGVAPGGTGLTAAQVAALDRVHPLRDRQVLVAFDGDGPGRQAAAAAYPLLRAVGARPDLALIPPGRDPADLAVSDPAALRFALRTARPLEDLVVDERIARHTDQLHWTVGRIAALNDAVRLVPDLPADRVARQVARLAQQLDLDTSAVTGAVLGALDDRQVAATGPPAARALVAHR